METQTNETKCTYCDGDGFITREFIGGGIGTYNCPKCNPVQPKVPFHTPRDFTGINRYNLPRSTTKRGWR